MEHHPSIFVEHHQRTIYHQFTMWNIPCGRGTPRKRLPYHVEEEEYRESDGTPTGLSGLDVSCAQLHNCRRSELPARHPVYG